MLAEQIKELKEEMVLSKLSDSVILTKQGNNLYVIIEGYLFPYELFTVCLLKDVIWKIKITKQDWTLLNKKLIELWTELDILPKECIIEIDDKLHSKYPDVYNDIFKTEMPPTAIIRKLLEKYVHDDENEVAYYDYSSSHHVALLARLENQYKAMQ